MPGSKRTLADRLGDSVGLLLCFCAQRARRTRLALPDGCTGYLGYPFQKKSVNNRSTCSFFAIYISDRW